MPEKREPPDGARERDARPAAQGKGAPGKDDPRKDLPPAGPHADPALTNPDATPGSGALPGAGEQGEVDGASG